MIAAPIAVVLGVVLFLMVRYGRMTIMGAVVAGLFGLFLGASSLGGPIQGGAANVAAIVNSILSGKGVQ
jgi:hypothetical protein